MKAKYKMTGCARFVIFLVIMIPIAYFGSKYLRDSGTWDKIKDKVENRDENSVDRTIDESRDRIDIPSSTPSNNIELEDQFERLRAAYEEQELVLARQDETIKELRTQNEALRKRINDGAANATIPPPPPTRRTDTRTNTSGEPSLDELLKEADSNLGTSSDSRDNTTTSRTGGRTNLGSWSYSFGGTTGVIELYQQDGRIFSKTTAQGSNQLDIDELVRSGDRLSVRDSPSGEYYVVRSDGNLDAYDQNGYQVTCRRK